MLQFNVERADKKTLGVECLKIVNTNEQCYVTDGLNITIRIITHDECYVSFEGVMQLLDNNYGYKKELEQIIVVCTSRVVLNPNHKWVSVYLARLKARVAVSFEFYFKILQQYMLANRPNIREIEGCVKKLVGRAEECKLSNNFALLIECCDCFDRASALMLHQIKNV